MKVISFLKLVFFILIFLSSYAFSSNLEKIRIIGNERISDETIKLFIDVNVNEIINDNKLNNILKDLYETNFFKDININFNNQILIINVEENPIIENIFYKHTLEIQLMGDYNAIYQYFLNIETLPEKFYWSALTYQVTDYPLAQVIIQIYTLSDQQDLVSG